MTMSHEPGGPAIGGAGWPHLNGHPPDPGVRVSGVDVVVPCYRYGHFLRECVRSALNQHGPKVRVLIIDDASPDNTSDVAAALSAEDTRVTWVRHRHNTGHIATYNEGIEWASSDYMLILSADDYLLPGALAASVDVMDRHPDVTFTFGRVLEAHGHGVARPARQLMRHPRLRILPGRAFVELSGARNIVPTPTAVVRTALQKQVGGYRPELPHAGDMEMWLRLAAHGEVGALNCYQAVYRRHGANMSLSYFLTDGAFPDLLQRKAALECFFESCRTMPHLDAMRDSLLAALAADAVGLASAAINEDNLPLSDRLGAFALVVAPGITKSWPWAKLACKRRMPALWRASRPVVKELRRSLARLRRSAD